VSTVVFFCIPAHGHTNPTLGVVRELTSRGHRVLYYSYRMFQAAIEAAGAQFIPCEEFDAQLHLTAKQAARVGSDIALSTRVLVDTTLAMDEAVCARMAQLRPDCIVADSMAVWGKAAARKLGIPFVCSTTTFAFNRHSAKIMKRSVGQLVSMLFSMGEVTRQVRRLQDRGYPVKSVLDLIGSDAQTDTIVYTSPQFQPCAETFPQRYAFVGPSIRSATCAAQKTKKTLVYIAMGTVNTDMLPLYTRCIAAFRDTQHQIILSVGSQIPLERFGALPENVSVFPSVDQIAVLEKADVFVSHCGMNSVSESLYFGVPLVMLPKTAEQSGVAARVAQLGAGIKLKKTTPRAIRVAVETVLNDPKYRKNAQSVSEGFRNCPGASGAADKILQVCAQK